MENTPAGETAGESWEVSLAVVEENEPRTSKRKQCPEPTEARFNAHEVRKKIEGLKTGKLTLRTPTCEYGSRGCVVC